MTDFGRRKGDAALLLALAAGQTVRDAACQAGVGERTANRRLGEPDFRHQLLAIRADMVQRAVGKLADGMTEAAETLRQLLRADAESVRLQAARSILELGTRLRDAADIEARLQTVEQQLHQPLHLGEPCPTHD